MSEICFTILSNAFSWYFLNHKNSAKCRPAKSFFTFTPPLEILSFRALQLDSIFWVWAPLRGSTKFFEWFTVK